MQGAFDFVRQNTVIIRLAKQILSRFISIVGFIILKCFLFAFELSQNKSYV